MLPKKAQTFSQLLKIKGKTSQIYLPSRKIVRKTKAGSEQTLHSVRQEKLDRYFSTDYTGVAMRSTLRGISIQTAACLNLFTYFGFKKLVGPAGIAKFNPEETHGGLK